MPAPHILALLAKLPEFEGSIPWMYLDTVGKVTVAVGLMLPDVTSAVALPFQFSGATAEPGDVRADFLRVSKMAPAKVPGFYHCETSVTLDRDYMQSLTLATLERFNGYLAQVFPDLDALSEVVKPALLDMIYNLGPANFRAYHQLIAAVEARNWTAAAANCHRRGPGPARNEWTAQQFLEAANAG